MTFATSPYRNGTLNEYKPLQLGEFLPEQRTVELNGQRLTAWVATNGRYPRRVKARIELARSRYQRDAAPIFEELGPPQAEGTPLTLEKRVLIQEHDQIYQDYLTDCICAVIPDLDQDTAELLPFRVVYDALVDLGVLDRTGAEPTEDEDAEEGQTADDSPLAGSTPPLSSVDSSPPIET